MKCPACGRGMLKRETYFECSNILCDYEEDIENKVRLAYDNDMQDALLLHAEHHGEGRKTDRQGKGSREGIKWTNRY